MKATKLKVISLHFHKKLIKIYKARKVGNPYENRYLKGTPLSKFFEKIK